jgi:hypothetical protein
LESGVTFLREFFVQTKSSLALARYLGLEHSPGGLWTFNEDTLDTSGNGNDMTAVSAPDLVYCDVAGGLRGVASGFGLQLQTASYDAATGLAGDLTVECIVNWSQIAPVEKVLVVHGGTGETEVDNVLYQISVLSTGELRMFWENGAGSNNTFNFGVGIPLGRPCLLQMTRTSNVLRMYIDGEQRGSTSGTLTAPTGGTNGRITVGHTVAQPWSMSSLKIIGSALSDAELLDEYNRSLGPLYGFKDSIITPPSLAVDQNNYSPARFEVATLLRLASTASVNITGFDSNEGDVLIGARHVLNMGDNDIIFKHEDSNSSPLNRIITPGSGDYTLNNAEVAKLLYDTTASRWRLSAGDPSP